MKNTYMLFRDLLIAIFGGFVGAVISEFAQGRIIIEGAFIVIMQYAIAVLVIIIILNHLLHRK